MKIYLISGLGADYKVLEKLKFPKQHSIVFLDWLIPEKNESLQSYTERMCKKINKNEPFALVGYSFGGIIAQEIHKKYPAKKIVILGSIKSDKEKSFLIKTAEFTHIPKLIPTRFFNEKSIAFYALFRKIIDPKNPKLLEFFTVKNAYYLKWSIEKISEWKSNGCQDVIQILSDKDIVFPLKNSNPNYVIKGGTHLFPTTKHKEVSKILDEIFSKI